MCSTSFILDRNLALILFGGKGGVGKTTCAAASALHCARRGQSTLLASTDPAHSLSDSLGTSLGNTPVPVSGVENLFVLELDASRELELFKRNYNSVLTEIVKRGTYFDEEDIKHFFSLSLPGLDELMAIIVLTEYLMEHSYDVIILDTAPTGHTSRMLELPEQMNNWLHVMDLMLAKHRYISSVFGRYTSDETDKFIESWKNRVSRLRKLLSDSTKTLFVPVMIPEVMSINETERLVAFLQEHNIPVKQVVINRIISDPECIFCKERKSDQDEALETIERKFKGFKKVLAPLWPREVKGIEELEAFGEEIFTSRRQRKEFFTEITGLSDDLLKSTYLPGEELLGKKYIIVGGKGGVGKTTVAAATGLYLSEQGKKVLLCSTDPAHSLSDCFGVAIGNSVTEVPGLRNLFGLEIAAPQMLGEFKSRYKKEIEEVFEGFLGSKNLDIKFDREVLTELINLTPPGLDEIMALLRLMEPEVQKGFDIFVLDSAPTGHLVRFLELPDLTRNWLRSFFKVMLKYREFVQLQRTANLMLEMARSVRTLQDKLLNPKETAFIGVVVPEEMIVSETKRLFSTLEQLKIESSSMVVNMLVPASNCSFCSQLRVQQKRYLIHLHKKYSGIHIAKIPLFPRQVKGIKKIKELSRLLFAF
jgi:arsenite-transporting ATPase